MELIFQEQTVRFLAETVYDGLCQEQTAEMTVPETMPEIARIVDCFGTVTVQNRVVENGSVSVTGGIQAGVLYVPAEDETRLERIDVYLPFTVTKKVPTREDATLFYWGWLRSVEARFINARKILVRAGLCSELTLLSPAELSVSCLGKAPAELACLTHTYPLRLPVCAAEKELQLADELLMLEDGPGADRLLKWTCGVEIEESRVIGEKAVFKGSLRIRVLFSSDSGRLAAWEGTVPFSQYAELDRAVEEGGVSIQPILRHVEIDTDGQLDSRRLLLNVSLTAQITVRADVPVTLTEDAYALRGSFTPSWQTLPLSPLLDSRSLPLTVNLPIPPEAERVLDWTLLPDCPAQSVPGPAAPSLRVNLVYFDRDRTLRGKVVQQPVQTDFVRAEGEAGRCVLLPGGGAALRVGSLEIPLRLDCETVRAETWRNLCGGTLEPAQGGDRPSLTVRRVSGPLWEVAKAGGSTVEALMAANHLDTDCLEEERLLLIPAGRIPAKEEEA